MLYGKLIITLVRFHRIQYRIAHIVDVPIKSFEELFLERKNNEHTIDIRFQFQRSSGIPGPHFWWYVVEYFNTALLSELSNASVEPTVIDQDDYIGFKLIDVSFALLNVI